MAGVFDIACILDDKYLIIILYSLYHLRNMCTQYFTLFDILVLKKAVHCFCFTSTSTCLINCAFRCVFVKLSIALIRRSVLIKKQYILYFILAIFVGNSKYCNKAYESYTSIQCRFIHLFSKALRSHISPHFFYIV